MPTLEDAQTEVSGGYREGLRRFLPRLCISVTLLVLLLIALEGLCFVLLQHQTVASEEDRKFPRSVYAGKPWANELWREWAELRSHSDYKAFVVWRASPYKGDLVNTDAQGLRQTDYSDCTPGAYTIWMFGNSVLVGRGSRDSETIPSLLAQHYQQAGQKVCVRNFGEHGWVGTQEVVQLLLSLKAEPIKPDLVVFYDGFVDAFLPYETDAGDVHGNYEVLKQWYAETQESTQPGFAYIRKSNTYRELLRLSQGWSGESQLRAVLPADASAMAGKTLDNYVKNLEIVETLGQEFYFRCAFFLQPTALVPGKPLTAEEERIAQQSERANPGIHLVFHSTYELFRGLQHADYFYLGDVFHDHPERLFLDVSHITPEANAIISDAIYKDVQSSPVKPPWR